MTLIENIRELADKPPLLAIPFFALGRHHEQRLHRHAPGGRGAGRLRGGAGRHGGRHRGACMFFAAISGSSPVTVITIGGVMYPALIKAGYPDRFSTAS
ncbi:MAG: TRAP transporter large permease subunit [bacterium]